MVQISSGKSILSPIPHKHFRSLITINSIIADSGHWTLPFEKGSAEFSTTYSRVHLVWGEIFSYAQEKPLIARFDEHPNKTITLSCRRVGQHTFTIDDLGDLIHNMQSGVCSALSDMTPDAFSIPEGILDDIEDDTWANGSFLDSDVARAKFEPIVTSAWEALWPALCNSKGALDGEKAEEYLCKDQRFLSFFAGASQVAFGKPLRGYQTTPLQFRPFEGDSRNVFIISGRVVIAWSQKRRRGHSGATLPSLWVLPPRIGRALITYLAIFRPIINTIVCQLDRSVAWLSTHIFVDSTDRQPQQWSGSSFTSALRSVLPDQFKSFDDITFGELFQYILDQYLPSLSDILSQTTPHITVLNQQGGHQDQTANFNYGLDADVHLAALSMSRFLIEARWAVCEGWQAFFKLGHLDEDWAARLYDNKMFTVQRKMSLAWEVARSGVISYLPTSGGEDSMQAYITQCLRSHPFFLPNVSTVLHIMVEDNV